MDYDATSMPQHYDAARAYNPGVLDQWMALLSREVGEVAIATILDLGSGTGRYSGALRRHFAADVIALDPSVKMLAEARHKEHGGIRHGRARGEALPLRSASIDLVFISMVFHHFAAPARVAAECRRILRPGGVVFLRAGTIEQIPNYAYLPFFPESEMLMRERLPRGDHARAVFAEAGLPATASGILEQTIAQSWAEYRERVAHRGDSILASLEDAVFEAGLARLSAHAAQAPAAVPVMEPIDFFVFRG